LKTQDGQTDHKKKKYGQQAEAGVMRLPTPLSAFFAMLASSRVYYIDSIKYEAS
jgi:hypothetical protein